MAITNMNVICTVSCDLRKFRVNEVLNNRFRFCIICYWELQN